MTPYFSIIIPVYNRANRLHYVLDSLQQQTFCNFETIIVDDASTDASYKVAETYNLHDKIVLRNEINKERCVSRNLGIAASHGKYICFLDSDDYHLPDHLQTLYDAIMEHGEPEAFFFTNAWDETENGLRTERCCPIYKDYNPYTYFLRYTVNPQRWAVHGNIMKNVLFDENVVIAEDMDVLLRLVNMNCQIYQICKRTTVYVAANDSFTHGDSHKSEKELFYYSRIFAKNTLKPYLPKKETNRLLSMCYFHLMEQSYAKGNRLLTWKYALLSYIKCTRGYNGQTNKIMLVDCLYSVPLIGNVIGFLRNRLK